MDVLARSPGGRTAARRLCQDAGRFRWAVTLTRRSPDDPHTIFETYKVARTPDQLCDIVMHSSLDPNVLAYSYHRYVEHDTSRMPTACSFCDEPFEVTAPSQRWRPCRSGGHVTYTCRACGADQVHPAPDCC